jgi:hypothetical protein
MPSSSARRLKQLLFVDQAAADQNLGKGDAFLLSSEQSIL